MKRYQRVTPIGINTGKVIIGLTHTPKPRYMSSDACQIQGWLLRKEQPPKKATIFTHLVNTIKKGITIMAQKKVTIKAPAIRTKKDHIVIEAPSKAWAHDQIEAREHIEDKDVKRGFVTSEDKFVKRKKAAKIAEKADQIKKPVKKLHSSDLRKSENIKKKVIK